MLQFRKAERKKAKARIGLAGPAGSGKTYSALLMAFGLGEKVAMIDTENGSGDLYAHLGDYDILTVSAPFTPDKYITAIKAAEEAGYGTVIIDSLSHAWAGEGGLLDMQGKIADSGKGNSYTAWRSITPKHNALVEAILQSKCHIIGTMRSKMDYVQQANNGRTEIKKVGLAPIQRDGMEYEFTVFLELGQDHNCTATKDRTSIFDGKIFIPSIETGKVLTGWLNSGVEETIPTVATGATVSNITLVAPAAETTRPACSKVDELKAVISKATTKAEFTAFWKSIAGQIKDLSAQEKHELFAYSEGLNKTFSKAA